MEKSVFFLLPTISNISARDEPELHMAFEVKDQSMSANTRYSYEPGDIVIGQLVPHHHWWTQIHIGHYDFILMHRTEGALLKKISHHDARTGTVTLHSLHPGYADFCIDMNDVSHVYNVLKVERRKSTH